MLKFKDLKGLVDSSVLVGIPELGINTYCNDNTFEKFGERYVERIFIDGADNDLIIDLKDN